MTKRLGRFTSPAALTAWLSLCALLLAGLMAAAPGLAAGELKIESLLPSGQVERLSQVAVRFDRPMRALGEMEQAAESAPLMLQPRPAGAYRWLDERTLAYFLDQPLEGPARLAVKIPAGTAALDGARLPLAYEARLETPPLGVLETTPSPGADLGLKAEISLTLSHPVRLETLAGRAYLLVQGRRLPLAVEEIPLHPWEDGRTLARVYKLASPEELPAGQRVSLVVEAGVQPVQGNLPSQETFQAGFHTFGPLSLLKWSMDKNSQGQFNPDADLELEFSNPVSPAAVMKALKLSPASPQARAPEDEEPSRFVRLSLRLVPRAAYKLELAAGLIDAYGAKLSAPVQFSLSLGDREPFFQLLGDKGVQEAGAAPHYPLRLRNAGKVRAALRYVSAEEAAPLMAEEEERAYDKKPAAPKAGAPGVAVRELEIAQPPNQMVDHLLDLRELLGRSPKGGLVLLDLRADLPQAKGKRKESVQRAIVQVTDLGLSLKIGQSGGVAWVSRLSSGQPLGQVALELRDRANKVLWKGQSNEQGLAFLPSLDELKPARRLNYAWKGPKLYLLAKAQDDLAVLSLDWADDLIYSLGPDVTLQQPGEGEKLLAHAITQLPLYQPGQTVRLALYLRGQDHQGLTPPPAQAYAVVVEDPGGRQVHSFEARPNAYGSLASQFALTPGARLGEYNIKIKQGKIFLGAGTFRVASFRPPDFKVGVIAPAHLLGSADQTPAQVQAAYLFGAPVAQGQAKVKVGQLPASFAPSRLEGWAVGDLPLAEEETHKLEKELGTLEAGLDLQGQGQVSLPAPSPQPGQPVRLFVDATVADASGLTVTGSQPILAHPAGVYLGIKAPSLGQAGQSSRVELLAATFDDQPAPALKTRITAYREYWETVRERGPGGFYRHLSQPRRDKVWETELDLPTGGGGVEFTPPQSGAFVLVAEAQDREGRLNRSATYLYASGPGQSAWQRFDDNALELTLEKKSLEAGQTARLLIKNPFPSATALISVERLGVSRVRMVEVKGPAPVIEVPIQAEDAPNAYLGVLLVRGRAGQAPANGPDLAKPQVRCGYVQVKVADKSSGLEVKLTPDREQARPGQEISAQVRVSGQDGQPRRAEVTLLAVDERVLLAAGEGDNYDPRSTFLRPRPLSVLTADLRTQVIGQRFAGQKGDEEAGGGGFGPPLRQDFHPAVFWLAQAQTDEQGGLAASFRLPDSLTAYRLVAVAADQARNFGLGKARVRARQPLQMLSALPRFATEGDLFSARVLVQNMGEQAGLVKVKAQAQGLELTGPDSQEVELAPGQSKAVGFTVRAPRQGQASLSVTASLHGHEDAARFTLPVRPATQLISAASFGQLDPAAGKGQADIPLLLPASAQPGRGGLSLSLAPSLAVALAAPAQLLTEYPWDCLEQRLSRAAALEMRLRQGKLLGLEPQEGDQARIAAVLASLGDFQTSEGGFTFWPGAGRANLYLTAYALLAVQQLERGGHQPPPLVKQKAYDYLAAKLKGAPQPRKTNRAQMLHDLRGGAPVAEALALAVLARAGQDVRPLLETALTRLKDLDPFGLAAIMLAAQAAQLDRGVELALERLEASASLSAGHLHFATVRSGGLKAVLGSELRSNALALWALSAAKPAYPRLENLAAWVGQGLGQESHLSTQEAVFGLWGISAFLEPRPFSGTLTMRASLAGRKLLEQSFDGPGQAPARLELPASRLTPGQGQTLSVSAQGGGSPLYSVRLTHAPAAAPAQPVNAGFSVSRLLKPREPRPEGGYAVGDLVECVITVLVADTRHHVLVSDPYPAGLEPASAVDKPREGRDDDDEQEGWDPWRWKEKRATELLLYAPRLDPGIYSHRYTLRAVAPGKFQQPPARAEEMYSPEVFGASPAAVVEVR